MSDFPQDERTRPDTLPAMAAGIRRIEEGQKSILTWCANTHDIAMRSLAAANRADVRSARIETQGFRLPLAVSFFAVFVSLGCLLAVACGAVH